MRIARSRPIFFNGGCQVLTLYANNQGKAVPSRCVNNSCNCGMCNIPILFENEAHAIVDEMLKSTDGRDNEVKDDGGSV